MFVVDDYSFRSDNTRKTYAESFLLSSTLRVLKMFIGSLWTVVLNMSRRWRWRIICFNIYQCWITKFIIGDIVYTYNNTLCVGPDSLNELVVLDNRLVDAVDIGESAGRSYHG